MAKAQNAAGSVSDGKDDKEDEDDQEHDVEASPENSEGEQVDGWRVVV